MLDYDLEAAHYDETRGGVARAGAAADAVLELLPADCAVLVDVACGTGIVSELLTAPGRTVIGVDPAAAMLALAQPRLGGGGHVVRGDATQLPLATGSVDAVTFMWLLHLVDEALVASAIAEAARALRPGGMMITTVDKNAAQYETDSDVGEILRPARRELAPPASDDVERVRELAATVGLKPAGLAGYVGHGQGRPPREWARRVREDITWTRGADPARVAEICRALEALPGQEVRRADPVYKVAGFRLGGK
ncbi:class I SAM-dependent methyltransferase [Catenulispora sp. NF23]|uniref:Class I SAM-dependent methyltransferase n=1 Tax=Catenulispora pinistramenti TaxID=2705254 RepID=A0ABS5KQZ5_9ACTN|nr:class I SAM-dependent methyltransferase [Catenulispora pinistramenti]MBS2532527.1 class I SAM-dependent methyltransferase [Catenulispora pinistramenti]MBS2548468.1 class I SAM-dependent methyltransferase [Catenulispora pinistramenti]